MKEIDWSIEIPFIFKISFIKYSYGLQGSFNIRILCFSFSVGLYSGLGWSANQYLKRWCYSFNIHLKRIYFSFTIGYTEYYIFMWRYKCFKKLKSRKYQEKYIKLLEATIEKEKKKEKERIRNENR